MTTLALLLSLPASALDHSSSRLFIPIASNTNGANGSHWLTDVILTSRHENLPTIVLVTYTPNGGEPREHNVPLLPRQTVTLRDVVGETFDAPGTFGTISLDSLNPSIRIAAHARVYNDGNPIGQFGQSFTALPVEQLGREAWLHGLNGVGGNRANVGIANPHDTAVGVWLSWYDSQGEFTGGVGLVSIPAHGVLVINNIFASTEQPYSEALSLQITSSTKPIYAYGSIVRNDTGDAYTILGEGAD